MNKENQFQNGTRKVYDEISAQKLCAGMMSQGTRHARREGFYIAASIITGCAQATMLHMHRNEYIAVQKKRLYRIYLGIALLS
jgi:DUF917 family protein